MRRSRQPYIDWAIKARPKLNAEGIRLTIDVRTGIQCLNDFAAVRAPLRSARDEYGDLKCGKHV